MPTTDAAWSCGSTGSHVRHGGETPLYPAVVVCCGAVAVSSAPKQDRSRRPPASSGSVIAALYCAAMDGTDQAVDGNAVSMGAQCRGRKAGRLCRCSAAALPKARVNPVRWRAMPKCINEVSLSDH